MLCNYTFKIIVFFHHVLTCVLLMPGYSAIKSIEDVVIGVYIDYMYVMFEVYTPTDVYLWCTLTCLCALITPFALIYL